MFSYLYLLTWTPPEYTLRSCDPLSSSYLNLLKLTINFFRATILHSHVSTFLEQYYPFLTLVLPKESFQLAFISPWNVVPFPLFHIHKSCQKQNFWSLKVVSLLLQQSAKSFHDAEIPLHTRRKSLIFVENYFDIYNQNLGHLYLCFINNGNQASQIL